MRVSDLPGRGERLSLNSIELASVLYINTMQVSLENSNFKQAVEDLTACLTKRIKALPADSRCNECGDKCWANVL